MSLQEEYCQLALAVVVFAWELEKPLDCQGNSVKKAILGFAFYTWENRKKERISVLFQFYLFLVMEWTEKKVVNFTCSFCHLYFSVLFSNANINYCYYDVKAIFFLWPCILNSFIKLPDKKDIEIFPVSMNIFSHFGNKLYSE